MEISQARRDLLFTQVVWPRRSVLAFHGGLVGGQHQPPSELVV